jgi:hypothetical protein
MAENIDPQLLKQLLTLNENEVIVPLRVRREDVSKIKAVKLSDAEVVKVQALQDYLTNEGYLADNTFASLFVYLFNLGYTLHRQVAQETAQKEAQVS